MGIRKILILASAFPLAFLLALAAGLTSLAQETGTVSVGSATINVGETVEIPIIYDSAAYGISGYTIVVSLANGAIADIESAEVSGGLVPLPDGVIISPDGNSVELRAWDPGTAVQPGASNVTLATVTFRGVAGGSSAIQIQLNRFDADENFWGEPPSNDLIPFTSVQEGTLTVVGPPPGDTIAPSFSNPQPAPGSTVDINQPTISIDITDDTGPSPSGVDPASIAMTVTGCPGSFTTTSPGASWSPPTFSVDLAVAGCALANGPVNVTISASDNAGNPASYSWSFTVSVVGPDTTPPSFTDRQPAPGSTVDTDQPTISVRITDPGSGVDPATISMRVTDASGASYPFNTESLGASFVDGLFSVNLSAAGIVLAEGEVTVEVSATDNVGNPGSTSWSFTVALPPPPTAPTVSATTASVSRGETAQIELIYNSAPEGLSGYLITVSLTNPAVANIEEVEFVVFDNPAKQAAISPDRKSVTLRGVDFAREVEPGDTDITLVRITLRGVQEGTTSIHIVLEKFDADRGADLVPTTATRDGSLTVTPGAPLPAVSAGSATINHGETAQIPIVYDQAPRGLSGYLITVSLVSPVAEIEDVDFVVFDNLAKQAIISPDRRSVTLRGVDFAGEVQQGDTDITLVRITLRGVASGTTPIQVRLERFDADDGSDLVPLTETREGSLTVTGGPTLPTVSAGSASCNVGDTVTIPITYNQAPQGLSGYLMRVSLSNPSVAEIQSVEFVVLDNPAKQAAISPDRKSVTLRGVDFAREVEPGDTDITLVRITFRCLQNGQSRITPQLERFDADGGADLIPTTAIAEGTLTVGLEVDLNPPQFSNMQPAPGSTASLQPTISVRIIDDGGAMVSGVDPASIVMEVTGCGSFTVGSTGASWDGITFAVDLVQAGCTLPEGQVEVTVSAADNAGNSNSTSWSFTASPAVVDDVPPSFSNPQPAPGSTVGTAQPTISIDITDDTGPSPSGVNPASIAMTVTGCARDFTLAGPGVTWDGITFAVDLVQAGCTLPEGQVEVTVSAADNAGNSNSTSWSFTVSVPAVMPGDVNGDGRIDRADASLLSRFIFTGRGLTPEQLQVANVAPPCGPPHDRSTINFRDVTAISQVAIGIRHEFVCFPGVPVSRFGPATATAQAQALMPLRVAGVRASFDPLMGMARFLVEGQGVREIRVEVFNLQGLKLWDSGFVAGGELTWDLVSARGEELANGVYLYIVTVRGINGEQLRTKVNKLVILR